MVYSWKVFRYPVDANKVGAIFEEIEEREGELKPESIVKEATPEDSVLHNLFEWNEAKAAAAYRISQAHSIINNLSITYEEQDVEPIEVRAYVNVSKERKGHYINVGAAFQSEETREVVMRRALLELKAFQKKYNGLQELKQIFEAINNVMTA